jgi:NAD(P)-dependent dehydrogenase (short-subunit alcohol dehydrogenase family)
LKKIIVVAGATGNLGGSIVKALLAKEAVVRALVRPESNAGKVQELAAAGAEIIVIESWDVATISAACTNANCVVSALSGLREVIVDAQSILLDAAVAAGVPRFIPSDYSIDFTALPAGSNRNLDLRREFHVYLDMANIKATTVFNGAFTDMLTGQMPLILFKYKRILHWGDAGQLMDFTSIASTAAFTANAALDADTPRYLRIAGDQLSPALAATLAENVTGNKYRVTRAGSLGLLGLLIKIARKVAPGKEEIYPAWQGMQYMHNMAGGKAKMRSLDNDRYPGMQWIRARDILTDHVSNTKIGG